MSYQKSHRIDLEKSAPCKHCSNETYTEYLCHPKYGRGHTDYHRYCPKCESYQQTDDGCYIYCPNCIALYSEKYYAKQAQNQAQRLDEEKQNEKLP